MGAIWKSDHFSWPTNRHALCASALCINHHHLDRCPPTRLCKSMNEQWFSALVAWRKVPCTKKENCPTLLRKISSSIWKKDLKHIFLKNIHSLSGGASGPGLFFILPCIDKYDCTYKVDSCRKRDLERSSFNIRSWQNHVFVISPEFVVLFILLWDEFPKCLSKLWRVTFKMPPDLPGIHVSTWGRFPMR